MRKMKWMTLRQTAFAVALASAAVNAYAATVTNMTVAGGTFSMGVFDSGQNWTNTGNPSANLVGGYNNFGTLFQFNGSGGAVNGFTGDGTTAPYGGTPVTGGPVPTFDATGSTITGNLSAFTVFWNGTNFNQGANPVSGTWNATTGAYNVSWSSTINGGPFNGQTGNWSLNGIATVGTSTPPPTTTPGTPGTGPTAPVPEASTTAMMLIGLTLLGGLVTRRRKSL
ncbi:MAG: PEP-CTERM sorting domain-containing protein [Acidiferrobacteraceae bacterium]